MTDLTDPDNAAYVRVSAVAAYFGVDQRTVRKWAESGHLAIRPFPDIDLIALVDVIAFRNAMHRSESRDHANRDKRRQTDAS